MTGPRAVPPRVVPTELAALALGVPPATIRKWASRGKLTRYGRPGRAEYDLDELLALAEARTGAAPAGADDGTRPQGAAAGPA